MHLRAAMAMHLERDNPVHVAIFTRAPVAGEVKTRLIPALGARRAARLHRKLTIHAVRTALGANIGPVTLWTSGDAGHPFFAMLRKVFGIETRAQQGVDLGERMFHAFCHHLPLAPTVVIGSDIPSLQATDLQDAAANLHGKAHTHISPTEDGGYALIGARREALPAMFSQIPWGGPEVASVTRARALREGVLLTEGRILWDVDDEDDLARLRALFPSI